MSMYYNRPLKTVYTFIRRNPPSMQHSIKAEGHETLGKSVWEAKKAMRQLLGIS